MSASENVRAVTGKGKPYSKIVQISNVDELAEELADLIPGGGGEGTRNHQQLNNRDAAGCHPSASVEHGGGTVAGEIEGLKVAVAAKADGAAMTAVLNTKADQTALDAETTARTDGDAALQSQIDALGQGGGGVTVHNDLDGRNATNSHPASAVNAGTEAAPVPLDAKLAEMDAALGDETAARKAGDAALQGQISTLEQDKADTADLGAMAFTADAPADGKQYSRQNNAWAESASSEETLPQVHNLGSDYLQNSLRMLRDVAAYTAVNSLSGTMKILVPQSIADGEISVEMIGYTNAINSTRDSTWRVLVTGRRTGSTWATDYVFAQTIGEAPFSKVRLASDGTNSYILLGEADTFWSAYPRVVVENVMVGRYGGSITADGWDIAVVTDEADLTHIVEPRYSRVITSDVDLRTGSGAAGTRVMRDVGAFSSVALSLTGSAQIKLPLTVAGSAYLTIELCGYNNQTVANKGGFWRVDLSCITSNTGWLATAGYTAHSIFGNPPFDSVRLGFDGTNRFILLGAANTGWVRPKIFIPNVRLMESIALRHSSDKWNIAISSNETAFTTLIDSAPVNRNITYGTTDLTAGTSPLPTGVVYLVYE